MINVQHEFLMFMIFVDIEDSDVGKLAQESGLRSLVQPGPNEDNMALTAAMNSQLALNYIIKDRGRKVALR